MSDISIFSYIALAALGLAVGSFLNVCIHRVPRRLSIISPSSRCPSCSTPIRPMDNMPVLSYVLLGGRCRYCHKRISPRYPLVEALTALLYMLVYNRFGLGWHLPVLLVFTAALIVITFIDLDFQIIPNSITHAGIPLGLLAGSFLVPDPFMRGEPLGLAASLIGGASGFGFFLAVSVLGRIAFKQDAMGGGDVKMMGMVGALTGWKGVFLTTFLGSLAGSIFGLSLMLFQGRGRMLRIPFGPFLALGSLVSLLFGQDILVWYLGVGR